MGVISDYISRRKNKKLLRTFKEKWENVERQNSFKRKEILARIELIKNMETSELPKEEWIQLPYVQEIIEIEKKIELSKTLVKEIAKGSKTNLKNLYEIISKYEKNQSMKYVDSYEMADKVKNFIEEKLVNDESIKFFWDRELDNIKETGKVIIEDDINDTVNRLLFVEIRDKLLQEKDIWKWEDILSEYNEKYQAENKQFLIETLEGTEQMEQHKALKIYKDKGLILKKGDAVPKVYIADANAAIKVEKENEKRAYERIDEPVDIKAFILVRTTNEFPRNGLVERIGKHTMPELAPNIFEDEIREITGLKDTTEYDILTFYIRGSTHWSLNGLVSSHEYGDFSGRNYILIEVAKNQIENKGRKNISEEDFWFEEDIKLSEDAVILIPIETYIELQKDEEMKEALKKFNVATFIGDEKIATQMVIQEKGYIYGEIGKWGFSLDNDTIVLQYNHKQEKAMEEIAEELRAKGRDVECGTIHYYSKSMEEDAKKLKELEYEAIERYVTLIESKVEFEFDKQNIIKRIKAKEPLSVDEEVKQFVEKIGLDRLKDINEEYNELMIKEHKEARKEKDIENKQKGLIEVNLDQMQVE